MDGSEDHLGEHLHLHRLAVDEFDGGDDAVKHEGRLLTRIQRDRIHFT